MKRKKAEALVLSTFIIGTCIVGIWSGISAHRTAEWTKVQALTYLCTQTYVPPQFEKMCKSYQKEDIKNNPDFFLDQNKK